MHFNRSIVLGYHSIPKINWDHFGVDVKRNGDHFGGCTDLKMTPQKLTVHQFNSKKKWSSFVIQDLFRHCTVTISMDGKDGHVLNLEKVSRPAKITKILL